MAVSVGATRCTSATLISVGTRYKRALFDPNESIKLFDRNAFSVHVPSQLEWN